MERKETQIRQTSRPQLPDMMRWWRKGWRGVFNEELYIKVCEIKAKIS